jgi:hypothetical protein
MVMNSWTVNSSLSKDLSLQRTYFSGVS